MTLQQRTLRPTLQHTLQQRTVRSTLQHTLQQHTLRPTLQQLFQKDDLIARRAHSVGDMGSESRDARVVARLKEIMKLHCNKCKHRARTDAASTGKTMTKGHCNNRQRILQQQTKDTATTGKGYCNNRQRTLQQQAKDTATTGKVDCYKTLQRHALQPTVQPTMQPTHNSRSTR